MEKNGLLHGDFTLPLSRDRAKASSDEWHQTEPLGSPSVGVVRRLSVCVCVFQVKQLLWNNDSTVLAVWLEELTAGADGRADTSGKLS